MIFKVTTDKDYKVIYKGEWSSTISRHDELIYFAKSQEEAKGEFKAYIDVKRFPKQFKIEDITPPNDGDLHTIRGNDRMVYVILNEEVVLSWNDDSNCDYPEDLTWDREISEVFRIGVTIGMKLE